MNSRKHNRNGRGPRGPRGPEPVAAWEPPAWSDLSKLRWDDGLIDAIEGIDNPGHRSSPETLTAVLNHERDPYAAEERLAIQEADGIGDRPAPWRESLVNWSDDWRERWGRRANELQDQGHDWYDAERLAFAEVSKAKRAESRPVHPQRTTVDRLKRTK